jgi:hypothetical protein
MSSASRRVRKIESVLLLLRLVVVEDERADVVEHVAAAGDDVDEHRRRHLHARAERLGLGDDDVLEALLAPADEALGRLLLLDLLELLGIVAGLREGLGVLDLVLGREHDDVAVGVVAGAARAARDLVEFARAETAHAGAVVLRQLGDEHGADRHVDADAQGVGAADDAQQPLLGERLDEAPIARQHAGVVHADARAHEARQGFAEVRREAEVAEGRGDLVALLAGRDVDARERLRAFHGGGLAEVHDVDRHLPVLQQFLHDLVGGLLLVAEVQRHGPLGPGDERGGAARAAREVVLDRGRIAERGRHQQELRARQQQQRDLPGPAAIAIAVVVELIHDHLVDVGVLALAEREVREDLGSAAHDGGVSVHRAVARDHADVLGAEGLDEREELLAHERLDRGRVVGASAAADRDGVRREGHERLARAGRCREDHVVSGRELHRGLVLRRVERDALPRRPFEEGVVEGVGIVTGRARGLKQRRHLPQSAARA